MQQPHNINIQDDNEFRKILDQVSRKYYLFMIGIVVALGVAFVINQYAIPEYKVTSSILINEDKEQQKNMDDFLNSSLFGSQKKLQNELLIFKSSKVIKQAAKNLELQVSYYQKSDFQYLDAYKSTPFRIRYLPNHVQPVNVLFEISFYDDRTFQIKAATRKVDICNLEDSKLKLKKVNWSFYHKGKTGALIENSDLSFIVETDTTSQIPLKKASSFFFKFTDLSTLARILKKQLDFTVIDKDATAIEVSLKTESYDMGVDFVNELTTVYSNQNLEKKNHLASITIDYIDKQLAEITDSLTQVEQNLQKFRSSNQLLNVTEQATGITGQYRDLQNQMAELVTKKTYYDYVADYLSKNTDFSNMIVPASLGIQDMLLNTLIGELITAQNQRSNLMDNNQEKNPMIKKFGIQIDNIKKSIIENISSLKKTTDIAIDGMNHRIAKIQAEISRLPNTERQLGSIERKYRLNDAIYNYLLEKRAEANITKASNLPDYEMIESAEGEIPVYPNKTTNYFIAFIMGLLIPFGYLQMKTAFNNKIETQDQIERITDVPVLGKILHNHKKTNNVVFDLPNSAIAESYRALRTNLEYYVRGGHKKVIMVTSSIEGEGKSFNALNIAMSYAQLDRRTILLDCDLRKHTTYFNKNGESLVGLSSFLINKAVLDDIIIQSPHEKLDYISSGPIPPNPVELIGLEKMEKLIKQLKEEYDYIIIDTTPLAQVTDAYLLIEQADVKVIITRYNYTLKSAFSFIMKDLLQKNINNTCIVLNDNRIYRDQYGYGYGYNKNKS